MFGNAYPTKGFEGKILSLLKRIEEKKKLKVNLAGKRRKVSRSKRELKKLEYSMNYSGIGRSAGELQFAY